MKTQNYQPRKPRYEGGIIVPLIVTLAVFGVIGTMMTLYGF